MMRFRLIVGLLLMLAAVSARAFGADDAYYIYQPGAMFGARGDISMETETAYGTRETRLLGANDLEQALRLRVAGSDWFSFEAWGGAAFPMTKNSTAAADSNQLYSFSGDMFFRILNQNHQGVNFSLGAGYLSDYQHTSIPRVIINIGRSWGRFDLSGSARAEIPIRKTGDNDVPVGGSSSLADTIAKYDSADWIMSVGASYAVTDWARVGGESVIEDVEGFWDKDEAEGGAKMVVGPTARFDITQKIHARLNTGAVLPLTVNTPTRVIGAAPNRAGFLGRLAFGYDF